MNASGHDIQVVVVPSCVGMTVRSDGIAMLRKLLAYFATFVFMGVCMLSPVSASLVITGTRILYEEGQGESVVQMSNQGGAPLLIQVWIDSGDPSVAPGQVDVPFLLTPPVVRIDPARGQAIRILKSGDDLPSDRESLFWFNAMAIPPKEAESTQFLQFAFRTRIKLFYRPSGIGMPASQATEQLKFQLEKMDGRFVVRAKNPSPYHVTFRSLQLRRSPDSEVVAELDLNQERMVSPEGELLLQLASSHQEIAPDVRLFFSIVNDYGGENQAEQSLQRADLH